MRRTLIGMLAAFALIGGATFALPAEARSRNDTSTSALLAEIRSLQKDLREVERDARGKRVDGREIRRGLDRMSGRLDHLERNLKRVEELERSRSAHYRGSPRR